MKQIVIDAAYLPCGPCIPGPHYVGQQIMYRGTIGVITNIEGRDMTILLQDHGAVPTPHHPPITGVVFYIERSDGKRGSLNHYKLTQMYPGYEIKSTSAFEYEGFMHNAKWNG